MRSSSGNLRKVYAALADGAARPSSAKSNGTVVTLPAGMTPRNSAEVQKVATTLDTAAQTNNMELQRAPVVFTGGPTARPSSAEPHKIAARACASMLNCKHSLEAGELHFMGSAPDLTQPQLLQAILDRLGACSGTVEKLAGFQGGLNDGVWLLQESGRKGGGPPQQDWILKLVTATKKASCLPTEAQNLARIASQHPSTLSDPLLAFPTAIFSCISKGRGKTHDLLVMRKARGERLCEVFARKWHSGQRSDCWRIIERVGAATAAVHRQYANLQHGDLQPANIFWDDGVGSVTIIDVGGMGIATTDDDAQHFARALRLLATSYGSEFETQGIAAFQRGYCTSCH